MFDTYYSRMKLVLLLAFGPTLIAWSYTMLFSSEPIVAEFFLVVAISMPFLFVSLVLKSDTERNFFDGKLPSGEPGMVFGFLMGK